MKIVKTKTEDKLHFTGFLSEPNQKTDKIIVHAHGSSGSPYENDWYPYFHELYPKNGYSFLVGQLRGTGCMTQFFQEPDRYPTYGNALEIFEESVLDIEAWVKYARGLGYKEIILQSHSFGPSKVVYYVNQKPDSIMALVFISPVDMFGLTMVKNDHSSMLAEAQELIKQGKPRQLLSRLLDGDSYMSAQTYINQFSDNSNANIFCYTGRNHDWSGVNNIKLPVLLIGGTKDDPIESVIKTEEAFKIVKSQLKNSPRVKSKVFEGADHAFGGFEKEMISEVINFLK